jgi:hypothetical protein
LSINQPPVFAVCSWLKRNITKEVGDIVWVISVFPMRSHPIGDMQFDVRNVVINHDLINLRQPSNCGQS